MVFSPQRRLDGFAVQREAILDLISMVPALSAHTLLCVFGLLYGEFDSTVPLNEHCTLSHANITVWICIQNIIYSISRNTVKRFPQL